MSKSFLKLNFKFHANFIREVFRKGFRVDFLLQKYSDNEYMNLKTMKNLSIQNLMNEK